MKKTKKTVAAKKSPVQKSVQKPKKAQKAPVKKEKEVVPDSSPSISTTAPVSEVSSNPNSNIIPLADRILIKPFTADEVETKNDFGIIIPDTISKERPEQGRVIAVGVGRYENGKLIPVKVKVGDKVIFSKYGFDEVKVGNDELYILKEESILAIIK